MRRPCEEPGIRVLLLSHLLSNSLFPTLVLLPLLLRPLILLFLLDTDRACIVGLKDSPGLMASPRADAQLFKATAVHGRVPCDVEDCFANYVFGDGTRDGAHFQK